MRIGVIDIGYNAIRAAAYENDTASAREIFNNKFKNDVFNLLASDELNIKHQTYLSIEYILNVFRNLNVEKIKCVATAVLRNHDRADVFLKHVKDNYNLDIEIISGEREAYLTATGMLCGIPDADGIAVDLGGGSLELAEVNDKTVGRVVSLELGTKIVASQNLGKLETLIEKIKNGYGSQKYTNLYLIGGALRFICRFYIDLYKYPLKTLHNLSISREECLKFLDEVSNSKFLKTRAKRKEINQNAILIAKAMIEVFSPENIIVSTYGLKEGVKHEMLSNDQKDQDIILMKLRNKFNSSINEDIVENYFDILRPLLGNNSKECFKMIQYSLIVLSSKFYYDQTVPPCALIEKVLTSEIQFTHQERIKIALIITYSTNFKVDPQTLRVSKYLLSKEENVLCQILGNFIRICMEIDGPEFHKPSFSISQRGHYLEVDTKSMLPRPIFEKVCDKLKSIAFGLRVISSGPNEEA